MTSDGGQVHKVSIPTEIPMLLCPELMSGAGEMTLRSGFSGVGAVSGMEGLPGLPRAAHTLHGLPQELWGEGLSLQARCFQRAFGGA